jgi:hypothetical protein
MAIRRREELLRRLSRAARLALVGSLSETYRTCGQESCRCHHGGPKHGPHLYVSFRGESGKTTGYYVPAALEGRVRAGLASWKELKDLLAELAERNRERLVVASGGKRRKDGSSRVPAAKRL